MVSIQLSGSHAFIESLDGGKAMRKDGMDMPCYGHPSVSLDTVARLYCHKLTLSLFLHRNGISGFLCLIL